MGKQSFTIDKKGWTWIFKNNKKYNSKPINNPYQKDLERVATSFYVSNLLESLDAKGLWNACVSYGRLVDAFIANKISKGGKRFEFIRFLARYQRANNTSTQSNTQVPVPEFKPLKPLTPNSSTSLNMNNFTSKPSFVSVIQPKTNQVVAKPSNITVRKVTLKERDLINIEDSSMVLLVKLKDVDTMGNIYTICKNVENVGMKSIFITDKPPSLSFKVDEHVIWNEISGLPLCAWGSNSYKRVAFVVGKFMFFEAEESTSMSEGRVCIATRSQKLISEKIHVEVLGESFEVQVQELGSWSINISDNSLDTSSLMDINDVVKVADSHEVLKEKEVNKDQVSNHAVKTSDPSRPPGFEHINRGSSYTSKYYTSFARHHKKDIKGISIIHELNRIIEVGTSLGYDVRGCRKSLNRMINAIGPELFLEGRYLIIALDHLWSDHTSILLHVSKSDFNPSLFKLYNS
ncbi:hypothetical protein Tco_0278689 [Tanacetum coccineum]